MFYLFPFRGFLTYFEKSRIEIPGDNIVVKKHNLAKIEGVKYAVPSNAVIIAKVVVLPVLNKMTNPIRMDSLGNKLVLVSVSPFKPSQQQTIFDPGQCILFGKATSIDEDKMQANLVIETISCIDSRVEAYELTADALDSNTIGYLARKEDIGNDKIPLSWNDKNLTIDYESNLIVVFDTPISELKCVGKSARRF